MNTLNKRYNFLLCSTCKNPIFQLHALKQNKHKGNIINFAQKKCHIYNELP